MAYVAGRHLTYNGKYYERGEVVDLSAETLSRIESYINTKTFVEVPDAPKPVVVEPPKKAKKAAPAPVLVEAEEAVEETPAED